MKDYLFTFEWENGCVNDYIIKYLREKNISYFYHYQKIVADLYRIGKYFKFDYEHINGNTFGIIAIETKIS